MASGPCACASSRMRPLERPILAPQVDWSSFTSRLAKAQRLLSEQHRLRRAHPRTGGRAKCENRPRKRPHRRQTPTGSDNLATFANNPRGYLLKHGANVSFGGIAAARGDLAKVAIPRNFLQSMRPIVSR